MSSSFILLGSGDMLPWDVPPALSLLHQLKFFNFPVPKGIILLKPELSQGVLEPSCFEDLELEIKQRDFKVPLILSLFRSGASDPYLKTINSASQLKESIYQLWSEALSSQPSASKSMSFLLTEKPQVKIQGKALSQKGFLDDWISFNVFQDTQILPLIQMPLEKLSSGERRLEGDFRGRVQDLLRATRRALGEDNWCLFWCDDGELVHLLSISALSTPIPFEEQFASMPLLENTPVSPSVLESSLIQQIGPKLFQFFSHWSPELACKRQWIQLKEDRLQFNFSLLEDFLRSFGLSTQVLFLLHPDGTKAPSPTNTIRLWRSFPRLLRLLHHLSLAPGIANRLSKKIKNFETTPEKKANELFLEWQALYSSSSHCLYRIWSFYLVLGSLLRILGVPSDALLHPKEDLPRWIQWMFFPLMRFKEKFVIAEGGLREATGGALLKINQCLEMKSLGWYARGLLPNPETLWTLPYHQVLDLDGKTPPAATVS